MDAIILAGGLGTRLRSVVSELPKCMAPVCGEPFLSYLLKYLSKYSEIDNVILSVGYLRESIFLWIDEHKMEYPFSITYAVEETPLGTGGGIKLAMKQMKSNEVIIVNGDTFFDVDIHDFLKMSRLSSATLNVALKYLHDFDRYGSVDVDVSNTIIAFNEKKHCDDGLINGGIYYADMRRFPLEIIPDCGSFEKEVLEKEAVKKHLQGYISDGYFIDIGIPEDYDKANVELKSRI